MKFGGGRGGPGRNLGEIMIKTHFLHILIHQKLPKLLHKACT